MKVEIIDEFIINSNRNSNSNINSNININININLNFSAMASSNSDRRITHIKDVFGNSNGVLSDRNEIDLNYDDRTDYGDKNRNKKYKTLERHLSMKKTIRKKMMRDLREIGDADDENCDAQNGFLDKLKTDQPPSANVDKPSLWKRLTKGWSGNTSKS